MLMLGKSEVRRQILMYSTLLKLYQSIAAKRQHRTRL